jgi:starch synthase
MRIAIAATEMVPYTKVGGLGDVIGALPKELARLGHEVAVFLPRPQDFEHRFPDLSIETVGEIVAPMGERSERVSIERVRLAADGVDLILIRHDRYFERPNPYVDPATGKDWPDNAARYNLFSKAIIEGLILLEFAPDAIHLNDYQTGLVPIVLREAYGEREDLARAGVVYSIHNMGYQGIYPAEILEEFPVDLAERFFHPMGPLEFWGKVNFMKAAILYADLVTTVSERYAREIQSSEEFGFGLEGVLRTRTRDLIGILNGIDTAVWNPATDALIPHTYGPSDFGPKRENKIRLLQAMELPEDRDVPVIGMISRLVEQKGFDLVEEAAERLMALDARFIVLGSGAPRFEEMFRKLRKDYPSKVGLSLTFNDPLAHLIEAGSDFFLMPSRYEPCGLNQMYSLRYGTVPIVRATGGLADTVRPYDSATGRGNGFVFEAYSAEAMLEAVHEGLAAYGRKRSWKKLVTDIMRLDFSWTRAAAKYVEAYGRAATARM